MSIHPAAPAQLPGSARTFIHGHPPNCVSIEAWIQQGSQGCSWDFESNFEWKMPEKYLRPKWG